MIKFAAQECILADCSDAVRDTYLGEPTLGETAGPNCFELAALRELNFIQAGTAGESAALDFGDRTRNKNAAYVGSGK